MHLLWLLNLRKIKTFRQAFKQRFHEQALVPEFKLSFEQVSQEVMVVEDCLLPLSSLGEDLLTYRPESLCYYIVLRSFS